MPHPSRAHLPMAIVVVIAVLVGWIVWSWLHADRDARISATNAREVAAEMRAACERRGAVARELGAWCERAAQVAQEPAEPAEPIPGPSGPPGPPGPPGDPPTQAQVDAAVARVLDRQGIDIPPSLIAAQVATFLQRNPPEPGEPGPPGDPPTAEQILLAVERWMADNMELLRGPPGEQGEQGERGPGPDPDEVAARIAEQVAQWFVDNPLPVCPEGTEPQAVTLLTVDRGPRDAVVCVVTQDGGD